MKLINHDLKDKWIATNHMTGNPELLDGTTCLVLSISVYLDNNEKLMATRIGSFKSPKISISVLVVPGLNVNIISCAQLCADPQCWIVLNGIGGYIYDKGGNKLHSLQSLGNLFILKLRLQSKSRCLVTLFSQHLVSKTRTCKCWNSHKAWIPWRSWWLPHLHSRETQTLQVLKKDILRSKTSRAIPLGFMDPFIKD